MNWLKKIWDKTGWILTLPLILIIGFLIIFAIAFAVRFVSFFLTNVPFVIWGNILGFSLLGWFGVYLKKLSRANHRRRTLFTYF